MGYDAALDNVSLPADCERERDLRPVYWTDGLGFFVMEGSAPGDKAWTDILTVALSGHKRWRVQREGMINLNALPYFHVVDDDGEILGA